MWQWTSNRNVCAVWRILQRDAIPTSSPWTMLHTRLRYGTLIPDEQLPCKIWYKFPSEITVCSENGRHHTGKDKNAAMLCVRAVTPLRSV